MKKRKVLAICGSTKSRSTSLSFLQYLAQSQSEGFSIEIYKGIAQLPHFNPELDQGEGPAIVKEFREKIKMADAVLFCTPEYVFSLPGSLKNAIEWNVSQTVFSNKPVAMLVAAASGEKAFASLGLILSTIECVLPETSKLLIQGAKGKITPTGEIKDEELKLQLQKLMDSLWACIEDENKTASKFRPQTEKS